MPRPTITSHPIALLGTLLGLTAALLSQPRPAAACGGFWCSQAAPVEQAGEEILFVHNVDGTVTAVIQIQYQGPAERFAWVLPIAGVPTVGVSSSSAFDALRVATDPSYSLQVTVEGTCKELPQPMPGFAGFGGAGGQAAFSGAKDASVGFDPISVQAQGAVGPYDYVVISVNGMPTDPAQEALDWLTTNGYDLAGTDAALLRPYLQDGLNLLAFRLTKGNSSGAIRPVMLTYASALPTIPIRPTAVAARDDMGVRVWVVSDKRAIPKNYKALELNEALINWFCPTCNYDAVVSLAADEAGGQGFVTELALPSDRYASTLWGADSEQQWQSFAERTHADGIDAIWDANNLYRRLDGWREAVEASVTLPPGASLDEFAQNPDAFRDTAQVDVATFKAELYAKVVKPVADTQALLSSRPFLTRLYSTMSADEMTMDPVFSYNGDLPTVSNSHLAKQIIECGEQRWQRNQAPWRVELPQGGVVRGQGSGWPLSTATGLAANARVLQLGESGEGSVVRDNLSDINLALDSRNQELLDALEASEQQTPGLNRDDTWPPPMASATRMLMDDSTAAGLDQKGHSSDSGGFCSVVAPGGRGTDQGVPMALAVGLGLLGLSLRRRARGD